MEQKCSQEQEQKSLHKNEKEAIWLLMQDSLNAQAAVQDLRLLLLLSWLEM